MAIIRTNVTIQMKHPIIKCVFPQTRFYCENLGSNRTGFESQQCLKQDIYYHGILGIEIWKKHAIGTK